VFRRARKFSPHSTSMDLYNGLKLELVEQHGFSTIKLRKPVCSLKCSWL